MARINVLEDNFIRTLDTSSKAGKFFLCLPVIDLVWGVYRIKSSLRNLHTGHAMLAGFLLVVGLPFMWLVDMISIIVKGHIPWFKYYKEDTLIEEIKHQREMRELEKQKQAEEDEKPKYNFKR